MKSLSVKGTSGEAIVSPPGWLFLLLSLLAVLYSVLPLTFWRLPNAVEILFAVFGLYVFFRYARGIRWSLPVKLFAAAIVIATLSWAGMVLDHPDLARSGPSLEDVLDKFMFLFLACVLAGNHHRIQAYLITFGLFVLVMPWLSGNGFSEIANGLDGVRAEFGINPIRSGLLFGAVALGLICFGYRLVLRPGLSIVRLIVWLLLLLFALTMLFITQSRTAMVALVPGLLMAFLLLMAFSRVARRTKFYIAGGAVAALVLSVLLSLALGLSNLIEDRFGQEAELVSQVIEGDLDEIPKSSWGLRLLFISEAFDGISERPLTGWGYRAGEIVLDTPELRQGDGGVFSQVHNSYLEAALRYGIGGLIVVLGLFAWAVVGILRCWRHRQMPLDMMIFLGATFSYFMVANLFDGLLFQTEGVLMFNVLMGVAASYIFQDMQLSAREPERHI